MKRCVELRQAGPLAGAGRAARHHRLAPAVLVARRDSEHVLAVRFQVVDVQTRDGSDRRLGISKLHQ